MQTISSESNSQNFFNEINMDAMLATALKEREKMLLKSPILQEFQNDINTATNGYEEVSQRLEGLAAAAKNFNEKRDIFTRLSKIKKNIFD